MLDVKSHFRQGGILGIEYHGRFVPLRVSHIGVDIDDLNQIITDKSYADRMKDFKEKLLEKTK